MKTGKYILHQNSFIADGKKFVIKERKKIQDKPKEYLISLEPFQYISSLFPGERAGKYTFDYEKRIYVLVKNEDKVIIEQAG